MQRNFLLHLLAALADLHERKCNPIDKLSTRWLAVHNFCQQHEHVLEIDRAEKKLISSHHQDGRSDDGNSKHLSNVGKLLPDYTAQHPRRKSPSNKLINPKHGD
jgi:hypothetical protein